MNYNHMPVLLNECIENLHIKPDGIYIDGTTGGGGHSIKIFESLGVGGRLICVDRDVNALLKASDTLKEHSNKVTFVHDNFSNIKNIINDLGIEFIDGVLLDLGVSSHQLDEAERGFSYMNDAPLDMRMNRQDKLTAADIVNKYSIKELVEIIKKYGEERWAARIAEFIVAEREKKPIETTFELVGVIKKAIPHGARQSGPHPAKRTFQAIRIEVNNELNILEQVVRDIFDKLNSSGRICVITFHSLEDRIIKNSLKNLVDACTCPRVFPVCICGRKPLAAPQKLIIPSIEEIEANSRARSAKLRTAEKL